MCSSSEAGSYLGLIDLVYHSTLGLRVIKKKRRRSSWFGVEGFGFRVLGFGFRVCGFGFRVLGSGFRMKGLGLRV